MSKYEDELIEMLGTTKRIRELTDCNVRRVFKERFEGRHNKTKN